MMINKAKLHAIALDENERERNFSSVLSENKELFKASMRIALKIKRALKHLKLTQNELAEKMGVDPAMISRLLNGKANFELKTLVKFEEVLGINIIDRRISPYSKESRFYYVYCTFNNINVVDNRFRVSSAKPENLSGHRSSQPAKIIYTGLTKGLDESTYVEVNEIIES